MGAHALRRVCATGHSCPSHPPEKTGHQGGGDTHTDEWARVSGMSTTLQVALYPLRHTTVLAFLVFCKKKTQLTAPRLQRPHRKECSHGEKENTLGKKSALGFPCYAYSIRQDTAGYGRIRQDTAGYGRIRQATAGYGRIRQDTAGYGRIRQDTQDTAGYGRIRQDTADTAEYGRILQDTAGYDRVQNICLFAL